MVDRPTTDLAEQSSDDEYNRLWAEEDAVEGGNWRRASSGLIDIGSPQQYAITVGQLIDAAQRSGLRPDWPPRAEPPILKLIDALDMLGAYHEAPLCLYCGLPGDRSYSLWDVAGVLCPFHRAQDEDEARQSWQAFNDVIARLAKRERPATPRRASKSYWRNAEHFESVLREALRLARNEGKPLNKPTVAQTFRRTKEPKLAKCDDRRIRDWCDRFEVDFDALVEEVKTEPQ